MKITPEKKELLFTAWAYCDEEDKSTEFMLQYMADVADMEYEDVVDFCIDPEIEAERAEWYKQKNKE